MIYEKALQTLEFPKILERLAEEASFSISREEALLLRPDTTLEGVRELQKQTEECLRLVGSGVDLSMSGAHDIRPLIARAELGGTLEALALLDVRSTLQCAERLVRILEKLDETSPWLRSQCHRMGHFQNIVLAIGESLNERGEVVDGASAELRRIRVDLRTIHGRLIDRLNGILASARYRPAVQESIITARNGRYVIPIKAESKGQVKGIVHDQSASGATLFIEPLAVTELNNSWHQLQLDERDEILRVLRALSALIEAEAGPLRGTTEALGAVDLCLAKARYGVRVRGTIPLINREGRLHLEGARHPLLGAGAVPITLWLGGEMRVLLITGPNTGGKTVALKTAGLLTLMAMSGLPIPAEEGSTVAVFRSLYADIGDEQSIEQSLSTFSGHLTTIISMLREMDGDSLVLLDELGAGTDPSEGAALARALLEHLLARDVRVIATTHYSELKAFAYEEEGVENASVEFDVETLTPTYRLSIGLPGRSNALAIAGRLGLAEEIIEKAQTYVSGDERRVETMLARIGEERDATAELYGLADAASREAAGMRDRLQAEIERLIGERDGILAAARIEAEASLASLRSSLDRIENEARLYPGAGTPSVGTPSVGTSGPSASNATREKDQFETLRRQVDSVAEAVPVAPRRPASSRHEKAPSVAPREIAVGDMVEVTRLGQQGTVILATAGREEVEVQVGPLRMRARREDVRLLSRQERREEVAPRTTVTRARSESEAPNLEIDLRGHRVDEIAHRLESYVHDAYMASMPFVRVIHGKGTGALRQVVRDELATNPFVSGFHTAAGRDGGEGVTIVELNAL